MPDFVQISSFELLVSYIYLDRFETKDQTSSSAYHDNLLLSIEQHSIRRWLNFLRLAVFIDSSELQKTIVFDMLIPKLKTSSALECLKRITNIEALKFQENQNLQILKSFCMFTISNDLANQIKTDKVSLEKLPDKLLSKIIQRSINYLKGQGDSFLNASGNLNHSQLLINSSKDLEIVVMFAANRYQDGDYYQLLQNVMAKFKRCSAFDNQNGIPQMK